VLSQRLVPESCAAVVQVVHTLTSDCRDSVPPTHDFSAQSIRLYIDIQSHSQTDTHSQQQQRQQRRRQRRQQRQQQQQQQQQRQQQHCRDSVPPLHDFSAQSIRLYIDIQSHSQTDTHSQQQRQQRRRQRRQQRQQQQQQQQQQQHCRDSVPPTHDFSAQSIRLYIDIQSHSQTDTHSQQQRQRQQQRRRRQQRQQQQQQQQQQQHCRDSVPPIHDFSAQSI